MKKKDRRKPRKIITFAGRVVPISKASLAAPIFRKFACLQLVIHSRTPAPKAQKTFWKDKRTRMLASYEMVFSRHSVEATHMKHQQDNCLKQDLHNGHHDQLGCGKFHKAGERGGGRSSSFLDAELQVVNDCRRGESRINFLQPLRPLISYPTPSGQCDEAKTPLSCLRWSHLWFNLKLTPSLSFPP